MGPCYPVSPRPLLWHSLRNFNLDSPGLPFLDILLRVLAHPSGAPLDFQTLTGLALELKRFLFLLAINEGQFVVPSPIIDRAWQVLLSYGRQAYSRFCGHFMKKEWHNRDFQEVCDIDDYARTLQLYKRHFGTPKLQFWPKFSNQEALDQAHNSFLWLSQSICESFLQRLKNKYSDRNSTDLQGMLKRNLKILRKRVYDDNEKLLKTYQNQINFAIQQSAEPFGSFAKLDRDAMSLELPPTQETRDTHLRNLSMQLNYTPLINPLPTSQNLSPWHHVLDRLAASWTKTMKIIESKRAQQQEQNDHLLSILKDDWRSRLKKLQNSLDAEQMPFSLQTRFMSEVACSMIAATLVFRQYKRFLILSALKKQNAQLACSHLIKVIWQYHNSESQDYETFCQHNFTSPPNSLNFVLSNDAVVQKMTWDLYKLIFNEDPPSYAWEQKKKEEFKLYDITGIVNYYFKRPKRARSSYFIQTYNAESRLAAQMMEPPRQDTPSFVESV